ncbi:MFS transporter [Micrococcus sp. EYE_162]|uniref:MFS transporter n=1 Tax=unclassified Micrococcus TaxID=2620948 RepID=UPI0020053F0A|nr:MULTISPECIES: MFS transporter [unclassified Micrococcus]MCK6095466.1 MFS transporter [Micrococcus sp. EYE_212]MCK6171541.1 MFS transporter [Micrococcus sp. EYE_162]
MAESLAPPAAFVAEAPVTPVQRRRAFVGAIAGHLIEWYDYGVYGFLAVYVAANFFKSEDPMVGILAAFAVFALSFFVRPLGGLFFGPLADRIGRRKTLMLVLGLMCSATAVIGMLPTYATIGVAAPALLVLMRLVQGFSAGGEVSTISAFVAEYAVKGRRGFATSFLMVTAAVGLLLGGVVANGLGAIIGTEAMAAWGWRLPFLLAGVLGAVAVFIRMKLEDSPEFQRLHTEGRTSKAPLRETLRHQRQLFLMGAVITLLGSTFYLVLTYLTTYMKTILEVEPGAIFWLVLLTGVTAAAFMPVGGAISDRMGDRRPMLAIGALLVSGAVVWFFLTAPGTEGSLPLVPSLLALGVTTGLYCGVPYATMTELMPAHVRSTGVALGYNVPVALFGGSAPFIATWLISQTGDVASPMYFFLATAAVSLLGVAMLRPADLLGHEDVPVIGSPDAVGAPVLPVLSNVTSGK